MVYEPNNDDAIQALDDYVLAKKDLGFAVISPGDGIGSGAYAVTVNSGNLDASDTLSVGTNGDEALFDGSTVSLSGSTNVQINSVSDAADGTEQYRYDVLWIDSNGEVNKTEGSVVKLSQEESDNNLTRFQRFKGAIPKPGTDPATVVAAVVVNSNDTSVGTSQLKDYRVDADTVVNALEAGSATTKGDISDDQSNTIYDYSEQFLTVDTKGGKYINNGQTATAGGGVVNVNIDRVEHREPGNASSSEAAVYKRNLGVNPLTPTTVRFYTKGDVAIDDTVDAKIIIGFADGYSDPVNATPDNYGFSGVVSGDGSVEVITTSGGTNSVTQNTSQTNSFVTGLEYIEISWDGSVATLIATDGTSTVTVSDGGQYPNEIIETNQTKAVDNSGSTAVNCDWDLEATEFR